MSQSLPIGGRWRKVLTSPLLQRSSQTLAVVNNTLYVYGGELRPREPVDSNVQAILLDEANIDSQKSVVSTIASTTECPPPRVGSTSAVLGDEIYIFSGRGGIAMAPIEEDGAFWKFSSSRNTWSMVTRDVTQSQYPVGRSYHAMTTDDERNIYVHAGCPEGGRLSDLWAFDLSTRRWTELASAPLPARGGPSLAFSSGKLFRLNGFDGTSEQGGALDMYDPSSNEWTTFKYTPDGQSGPTARSVACLQSVRIAGRPMLVTMFGESDPSNLGHQGAGKMLSDVWVFDIEKSEWKKVHVDGDEIPPPRGWFDAVTLEVNSKPCIAFTGGLAESNERLDDLWLLQFSS